MSVVDSADDGATRTAGGACVNALSVDVEDWYHDESRGAGPATPDEIRAGGARVERNLDQLLTLLDAAGTRATFFFLAGVAEQHPRLTRAVADAGHELACDACGKVQFPRTDPATGERRMGAAFAALLGFHKLYSRLLLRSASARLSRQQVTGGISP